MMLTRPGLDGARRTASASTSWLRFPRAAEYGEGARAGRGVSRIYLSPPHLGDDELQLLLEAFDSNWISSVGPQIDAFEEEMAAYVGVEHAVAVSSGTAALHLALLLLGVGPGDEVLVSTFTFVASANAVGYVGARPVFVDSDWGSWNMDPALLADELERRAKGGRIPAAVIVVDLYGQCADYEPILSASRRHGVPVVQDAAEALGATYQGAPAGRQGDLAVLSFNGNKIITTSAGGMLLTDRTDLARKARSLATQAREPAIHYEHRQVGFNYRMSNLLAAVGRGQLRQLPARVERRRAIKAFYRAALEGLDGIQFMPDANFGRPTNWLTCLTVDPVRFGASRDDVLCRLEAEGIEARPTWKPMHLQPLFAGYDVRGGAVSESIFATGLCLPSGSSMTEAQLEQVAGIVASTPRARRSA